MNHVKTLVTTFIALASLSSANLSAWDDHPDDDDPLTDVNMFKIVANLSPEEQEECIHLLERDEDDRLSLDARKPSPLGLG